MDQITSRLDFLDVGRRIHVKDPISQELVTGEANGAKEVQHHCKCDYRKPFRPYSMK